MGTSYCFWSGLVGRRRLEAAPTSAGKSLNLRQIPECGPQVPLKLYGSGVGGSALLFLGGGKGHLFDENDGNDRIWPLNPL